MLIVITCTVSTEVRVIVISIIIMIHYIYSVLFNVGVSHLPVHSIMSHYGLLIIDWLSYYSIDGNKWVIITIFYSMSYFRTCIL